MSVIEEALAKLDVDPVELTRVAKRRGIDPQHAVEKLAYRRAVISKGGKAGADMASVVIGRRFKGIKAVAASIIGKEKA